MANLLDETYNLLTEWGHWVRCGGLGLQYRSPCGIIHSMQMGTTVRTPQINDESAARVDTAVARLKLRNQDLFQALVLTFIAGMSQRQVAKSMRLGNQGKARDLINQGVACIDILLSDLMAA